MDDHRVRSLWFVCCKAKYSESAPLRNLSEYINEDCGTIEGFSWARIEVL